MVINGFSAISNLAIKTNRKLTEKIIENEFEKIIKEKKQKLNFESNNLLNHISPFKKSTTDAKTITDDSPEKN